MKNKKVALYYFTGTGNTLLIVKKMAEIFSSLGVEIDTHNLVNTDPQDISKDSTIGLAFPVACFSTYPLVWDFIEGMPDGQGTEIFMVDTFGSFSGVVTSQIRNLLVKKNYQPIGAKEIKMPNNISNKSLYEQKNQQIISSGLQKAKYYTHDLVYGITKWKPILLFPSIFNKLNLRKRAWDILAKKWKLTVDNIKCIRCGYCYKLCPTGNVEMEEYPEFLDKCQFCMRCISFCPTQAIRFNNRDDFYPYQAQEAEEVMK
ncbi:MAG: EFR1 family ferrodoxin [Candidatus Cloacimonetes bacterium]|nr:EFR1 family ferrodoxin [Candidatus Cloacimonadota bacterium]